MAANTVLNYLPRVSVVHRLTGTTKLAFFLLFTFASMITYNTWVLLGLLAVRVKERKSGKEVYYNRNFHIEPTTVCVFNCRFCSYRRPAGSPEAWVYDERKIHSPVEAHRDSGATEVHIVGGVHPRNDLYYYADLIRKIKRIMPQASVKAFTAIELAYMIRQAGLAPRDGLLLLKQSGMEAIPGGGAEIFGY